MVNEAMAKAVKSMCATPAEMQSVHDGVKAEQKGPEPCGTGLSFYALRYLPSMA